MRLMATAARAAVPVGALLIQFQRDKFWVSPRFSVTLL
jgi:hypothetical protein